ncbi:hypothetical protein CPC08DRAFT_563452 [Agrocybe pediades]|nr:hypothetical protein CPC08DRAFT_563452 [Agrocybe pediades]
MDWEEHRPTITVDQPSDDLIAAFGNLSLSTLRMQTTRQLPFLVRNLRQGFLARCRKLSVPIYHGNREIDLQIQYQFAGGHVYEADLDSWRCPLCDLLGEIRTREMLDCHMQWDHSEVYYEWQYLDDSEKNNWKLQLVIPEVIPEPVPNPEEQQAVVPENTIDAEGQHISDLTASNIRSTPVPSVPLPPVPDEQHNVDAPVWVKVEQDAPRFKQEAEPSLIDLSAEPDPEPSPSRSPSASTIRKSGAPEGHRYPTPPPKDDPLGPAARPPYLPAVSDYGGPTIYHSCRPGGPCLFDLLGTLPMEQFGLLDWEVLDREDEIYESDDIEEQYKVMHALWARWIMLNRNTFISDHLKGTKSFIDEYWKIIHKAAGWDALRYFLFMLLANQFLTGKDIAQVLKHYEKYTGMEFWYD